MLFSPCKNLPRTRSALSSLLSTTLALVPPIRNAFDTLAHVLRNSLLCVAVGWLFGYCFTIGNVLSGRPPGQQSYEEFSASNIAWFYGIFSACMIILMATKLLPEQFIGCRVSQVGSSRAQTARRLNILQCVAKLLRPMAPHLVLSSAIVVGGDYAMYSTVPASWRQFKPCVYIAAFWGFYIMVVADMLVRHIFQTETLRGVVSRDLKTRVDSRTINHGSDNTANGMNTIEHRTRRTWLWVPTPRRFFRVYVRNLPVMLFVLVAIVYVHVISHFVQLRGQWQLFGFTSASIALKITLQELAKGLLLATHRPISRRVMVVLVSTPTIIVDTQVRMLLLRQASVNTSVIGTILIAAFEITVRAFKSLVIQRRTRGPAFTWNMSRRSTLGSTIIAIPPDQRLKPVSVMPVGRKTSKTISKNGETAAQYKARREVEGRRQKHRVLHAAEIYADMYAEYIAIGCSYAILFFYRNHPQFQFTLVLYGTSDQTSDPAETSSTSQEDQILSLGGLQLGVEVVVDFLACVAEAVQGVEFKSVDQNDAFLVFFLAVLSFSNVAISAGLYMH